MIDIARIDHICTLYASRQKLEREIRDALQTEILDKTQISFLFGALTAIDTERDVKLFVLFYVSAPEVLAGQKMRRGLRSTFATLFGYKTGSAISMRSRDLLFRYQTYVSFREKVNNAMEKAEVFLEAYRRMKADEVILEILTTAEGNIKRGKK